MDNKQSKHPNAGSDLLGLKTVIRTKNFEAARRFYSEVLNLVIVEEYDDGNGSKGCIMGFSPEANNAFLEISEIKSTHSYYQTAFSRVMENDKMDLQIKTDAVDYWAEKLNGICETRGPVERPWGSRYLYLRDPDGVHIIIYEERKKHA